MIFVVLNSKETFVYTNKVSMVYNTVCLRFKYSKFWYFHIKTYVILWHFHNYQALTLTVFPVKTEDFSNCL